MKAPLSHTYPEIAAEWHPTKNNDLTPDEVVAGSHRKVWWRCHTNPSHVWEAAISNRTRGKGCPYCSGRAATPANSLAALHPEIAAQWHPTKNGDRTPTTTSRMSNKKVWWHCDAGPDHEWEAVVYSRTGSNQQGCPFCAGKKLSVTNSLTSLFPEIATEWHPTKNENNTPEMVVARSADRVWWKCSKGLDHEWQTTVYSRTQYGSGCPFCAGQRASSATSIASACPDLAAEWHPTKNGDLSPEKVMPGSGWGIWWRCSKDPSHEWQASPNSRTNKTSPSGCPCCAGRKVSSNNSLATCFPEIAAQWHFEKNEGVTPEKVVAGSTNRVWWKCPKGPDHEWQGKISDRIQDNTGCPFCAGKRVSVTNSLASLYPAVAAQWHPTKNAPLTPDNIVAGSEKVIWWKCPNGADHEWEVKVEHRTRSGSGCPCCSGRQASSTNSLAALHPELATEWHWQKNGNLTPEQVPAGSHQMVWWKCPKEPDHEWRSIVYNRTKHGNDCPRCNQGWSLQAIRAFVASLHQHLHILTPAELYLLFQQNGLLRSEGKGKTFVKALATGRFPKEEVEKFVNGDPSLVDEFIQDPTHTLESLDTRDGKLGTEVGLLDNADKVVEDVEKNNERQLPIIETKDVLAALGLHVFTSADEEAVEFLLASAVAKIWKHAYSDEEAAVTQAKAFSVEEGYAIQVRSRFLDEFRQVNDLAIPPGYTFHIKGKPILPNLMQRHFAVRVREQKRVGNWSGTGAGKTLAAILATRVVGSKLTVICCPNSVVGVRQPNGVVDGWWGAILDVFPDSVVATKTFNPDWAAPAGDGTGFGTTADQRTHRYLILNYEALQQPDSAERVRSLVESEPIDFVIVDEIHYAKQRTVENISLRRQIVTALATLAAERNPELHVLGMSATPVINNLHEGKSMVELVSGLAHDELDTRPTVPNCMKLHQRLVTLGIRWMPDYKKMLGYECREERIAVDCAEFLDEIRALGRNSTPLGLELILTRARLPVIRQHVKPKTLIYTYYIDGIDRLLRDALMEDGWNVGFYTGEDKSGKDAFIKGDLDVLIATAAIGTGVDGLQHVCNRLIINVLPWTRAEFDQLLGRIYRQGQLSKEEVTVIIPLTFAQVNGQRWSWCESKMQRLAFKKSIADAAVDGVVPEGHLRSPAQAYQDVMAWLGRLETGEVEVITRSRIVVPLPDTDSKDVKRRQRRYGDFSAMNRNWNQSKSETTHQKLQDNPEEWEQYHTLYRETRKDWAVIPYEEMIRWCEKRSGYVIGDFGCGEAKFAESVSDRHTVHSFDHVAINENVVACNMAHVPLEDETLDLAIFSLSLMGANFADYLREAYRTLKLDGDLHIIEATSRFTDRDEFVKGLKDLGFAIVSVEDKWKFTHIRALKTERGSKADAQLRF